MIPSDDGTPTNQLTIQKRPLASKHFNNFVVLCKKANMPYARLDSKLANLHLNTTGTLQVLLIILQQLTKFGFKRLKNTKQA